MNKILFLVIGLVALFIQSVAGQTILFSTSDDFTGWISQSGDFVVSSTTDVDLDNLATNGLGNTATGAGQAGTPGALALSWVSGNYDTDILSQDESRNEPFLTALEAAKELTLEYTVPPAGTNSYFQLLLLLNFDGGYWQITPSATTTSNGVTTATFSGTTFLAALAQLRTQDTNSGGPGFTYMQVGIVYNSDFTSTDDFYVDNIQIPASPVLSIQTATPGLNLFTSVPGNTGQRQNIKTAGSYPWIGDPATTEYALTIGQFPGTNHGDFQAQVFLVPGSPGTESAPDYNEANGLFLQITNNFNSGGGTAMFMYKTNAPYGYPFFTSNNILAAIPSPQVAGTWTLTFQNNTNITLTTPGNTTTNFSISTAIEQQFAGNLYAYFGVQPTTPNNVGQSAIFSRIQITNSFSQLNESFTNATLNPALWTVTALDPNGVIVAAPGCAYWLNWTSPNGGYTLLNSASLTPPSWVNPGLATHPAQDLTRVLVYSTNLPSPGRGFYILSNQ